jgi:hypothetical protein
MPLFHRPRKGPDKMILKAIIDDQEYSLNVPDQLLTEGEEVFAKLDADMDQGWQMSREWVAHPDPVQRCQIVADKLLTALETENHRVGMLMAGYILSRLPGVEAVEPDTHGEIQNTLFTVAEQPDAPAPTSPVAEAIPAAAPPVGLSRLQAMEQAGNDVTKVFRVGKGYRFSVYDHAADQWRDSPLAASREEAERLREAAFKERFEALQRGPH